MDADARAETKEPHPASRCTPLRLASSVHTQVIRTFKVHRMLHGHAPTYLAPMHLPPRSTIVVAQMSSGMPLHRIDYTHESVITGLKCALGFGGLT